MNMAHLHLLLNHVPTIGSLFAVGLFLLSLIWKNNDLKRASLAGFFILALLAIPTYQTGNAAQEVIRGRTDVSEALIASHRDAALLAFIVMELTGAFAWLGLWQLRRTSRQTTWNLSAVLFLSIVTIGVMTRAANFGGEIHHPEIRAAEETTATETADPPSGVWFDSASIALDVTYYQWAWPTSETLHFVGLALLFGIVLVINLRMLGVGKSLSFASLHRLLPWAILGFGMNLVTGMLFFIATPEQYTQNIAFYWKMALVLLAGVNALYLTVVDEAWVLGPGDDAPWTAKVMAASGILLWAGVMYCGRMLPFIGNSF
jgi:hypothetical protein